MNFADDKAALEFLARFTSSDLWKWMEEVLKARRETIITQLDNPRTTADGRAMLNGRLVEIHRLLEFPVRSYQYYQGNKAAEADTKATPSQREAIISKVAFPDIVTGE